MYRIALDAGHGLNTSGKRCLKKLDPNQTREWWLNDRIADKIEKLLQNYTGYELIRVDDTTGKKDVSRTNRIKAANNFNADVYLSIHHNAGANGSSSGGIVAYICKNAQSVSVELQKALYNALIDATWLKGNRSNPLAQRNFDVVKKTTMPAVLLELGFMDSSTDVPVILTDEYADQCAGAIVKVLVEKGKLQAKISPDEAPQAQTCSVQLPVLKRGDKSEAVAAMQILLIGRNCSCGAKGPDGSFGPATESALLKFRAENGLASCDVCDAQIWEKLLGV